MKAKLLTIGLLTLSLITPIPVLGIRPLTRPSVTKVTAFIHANVIPMDEERVLDDQTVIIRNGRIAEIGPSSRVNVPKAATIIDARGKYLMPGLADMHTHLYYPTDLLLYIANGVTTVRNMQGHPAHLVWRERVSKGELLGPTIVTAGPTIFTAKDADEAERIVEEQKKAGYDFIKVYNQLSSQAYERVIATAKRQNMQVAGHIPYAVGLEGVIKAKQSSIEHAEEIIKTYFSRNPPDQTHFDYDANDEQRIPQIASEIRNSGVWVVPTLVTFRNVIRQIEDLPLALKQPGMDYLPPWVREQWGPENSFYRLNFSPDVLPGFRRSWEFQNKLVRGMHEGGVRMLVGTDAMVPGNMPAFTIHEELRNLVNNGFTPFEALQAATRNSAEFLNQSNNFGTVAVGQRADLILLNANPLRDMANTTQRSGVMVRGRWFSESHLRQMLNELSARNANTERFVRTSLTRKPKKALLYLKNYDAMGQMLKAELMHILSESGIDSVARIYWTQRRLDPAADLVHESTLNSWGYELIQKKKMEEAIAIFDLNVAAYPKSANTYDSLAEAYLLNGNNAMAIEFYEKALAVDPKFANSAEMLKKLTQK
jgi:tetratricopeptide (TPR) repeat protein